MQTFGKCCRGCVISRYCIRRILATITDISYLYCSTDVELFAGVQLIFERMDIWQGSAGSFMALASVSQRLRNTSHGFSGFSHRVWSALWFHTTSCRITYHPDQLQSQPVLADTLAQWDECFCAFMAWPSWALSLNSLLEHQAINPALAVSNLPSLCLLGWRCTSEKAGDFAKWV